nr:uncharacterized protein LOC123761454 [Procambarus clarkii]
MSEATELEYVVLTPDDLDDVIHLLVNHYYSRENIRLGAGMSAATKMDEQYIPGCLRSGLSTGARDERTGRLVGVVLSYSATPQAPQLKDVVTYITEAELKVLKVKTILEGMLDLSEDRGVECVQRLTRFCVQPDYGSRGVARMLVQKSMDLGAKQGCQLAYLRATSPYTQKLCDRLGFDTRAILDLSTLEEGLLDLSRVTCKTFKVMTKNLTPKETIKSSLIPCQNREERVATDHICYRRLSEPAVAGVSRHQAVRLVAAGFSSTLSEAPTTDVPLDQTNGQVPVALPPTPWEAPTADVTKHQRRRLVPAGFSVTTGVSLHQTERQMFAGFYPTLREAPSTGAIPQQAERLEAESFSPTLKKAPLSESPTSSCL